MNAQRITKLGKLSISFKPKVRVILVVGEMLRELLSFSRYFSRFTLAQRTKWRLKKIRQWFYIVSLENCSNFSLEISFFYCVPNFNINEINTNDNDFRTTFKHLQHSIFFLIHGIQIFNKKWQIKYKWRIINSLQSIIKWIINYDQLVLILHFQFMYTHWGFNIFLCEKAGKFSIYNSTWSIVCETWFSSIFTGGNEQKSFVTHFTRHDDETL